MKNDVFFGEDALNGLKKGVDIVARAVGNTMGAAGKNVVYNEYGRPISTNDGVSVAKKINLKDEHANMGAALITQAAKRTEEEAGDGTSTAIILGQALVDEGLKKVRAGMNPMTLKKQMEVGVKKVIEEIKAKSRPVKSDDELLHIANISVENEEVATIVRDAAKHAGVDGTVVVDESTGVTIEIEKINGCQFEHGYISPYMVTSLEKMEAVMEGDVHILMTDKNMNMVNDFFPLWEKMMADGIRQCLVLAGDVSGELLATMIATRHDQRSPTHFLTVAVKAPYHKEFTEDIAILTGGETMTEEKGYKQFLPEHFKNLGKAGRVIVTKDSTIIMDGKGDKVKIQERVTAIKNEMAKAETYEKNKLKTRLARLIGGVVVLKVGAPTESEMKYMKRKIDDAVSATRAAMEEGIVIGGGRTLYDVSLSPAKDAGEEVVRKACGSPIRRIIDNAGEDSSDMLPKLKDNEVFNASTGKITGDPIKEGILDPVKVERCALANAVSFAANFITTGSVIVDLVEKESEEE